MKQECKFCPDRDLQEHVPNLSIDISKAIDSGTIFPESVPQDFNHMDIETVQNGVRLHEPFDAIDYHSNLSRTATEFSSGTGNIITPSTPPDEGSGN